MIAASRTHQGKVRLNNQDSLLIRQGPHSLYAVADGMGGHRGGNVASAMAVNALNQVSLSDEPQESVLMAAVNQANAAIWEHQLRDLSLSGMGTTLTVLWEGTETLLIAHVGDSRAYRFFDGVLTQVTTDHSLVGELLRSGAITAEMARKYPYRNIVTRAVGTDASLQTDICSLPKLPGSRWLLCSDGLTEYALPHQLEGALKQPLEEAADQLMSIALEGGGRDNITLIILEVPA
jgi:protein phosphatase